MREWLRKTLSETDGTPSSRRQVYLICIVFAMGLAVGLAAKSKAAEAIDLTKTLVLASGGTLAVGKFAERKADDAA